MKQPTMEWDGVNRRESVHAAELRARDRIAELGRDGAWDALLDEIAASPRLVNSWRAGGASFFTPLHHAAHGGAPAPVVERLLELGAWRTLRTAGRERAVDVARTRGHGRLLAQLEPVIARPIAPDVLGPIERHFHAVIDGRSRELIAEHAVRLPPLELLTEHADRGMWFPIPGMSGGFACKLADPADAPRLVVTSWSLSTPGSGQWHEITPAGGRLVAQGFL